VFNGEGGRLMLLLTFRAGESFYAVDARQVVEVVPRVGLRSIPHAPDFLVGLLSYRGQVVPVVDFNALVGAQPLRDALSTRVILTEFTGTGGESRYVGVVAQSVNQVLRGEPGQNVLRELSLDGAPYLGGVFQLEVGLVQLVKPGRILPERLQDALYGNLAGSG
jgi:chemotaxis-related protein WspB